MDRQFRCKSEGRRKAVGSPKDINGNPIAPLLNGIDYLEVVPTDQKILNVYFLHPLPGQTDQVPPSPALPLKQENILIEGGIRTKNVSAEKVIPNKNVLKVITDKAGDFSKYKLRLITSPTDLKPPTGFDPQLSAVEFFFKAGCPSEFDCKAETVCPPEKLTEPEINYLAKDYASFRRLMLDRMSVIMPDWKERNPADLQIALVELLAYVGDYLSYYQDAVATEAYLGTARRRVSVRRHARLLDYFVHDGCNARALVCFEVKKGEGAESQRLPTGTKLMTCGSDDKDLNKALNEKAVIFETRHDIVLRSSRNKISFYTWSDSECCLPRGSIRATLQNDPALFLKPGDLLIFEEVSSPTTGKEADPSHRHAVRLKHVEEATVDQLTNTRVIEIEWYEEDALPFPLCLTAIVTPANGKPELTEISIARGNVVLADHGETFKKADHGETFKKPELVPEVAPDVGDYRPKLQHTNITIAVPYDDNSAKLKAAAGLLDQDPHKGLPWVKLYKDEEKWGVQRDLMESDRFANEFVVEIEGDGTAQIRFGDDVSGKKPPAGFEPSAIYRIGNGREGNIGADTLVVCDIEGIDRVRNPLPASGGRDAETMEEVRQFAPHAFRTQKRAVTESDYAEMAQLHSEVQKAKATFRWTGSWHTVFVTVDRKGGWEVDKEFKEEIRQHLEKYRLAGYDLEISSPVFVPLDILMTVCVRPGYFRSKVKENLLRIFSRYDLDDGTRGFFHPDNFTFGQPVYLSQIYKNAMEVAGVASVGVARFQRWGKKSNHEIEYGMLVPADFEIVRLDNDPNFPENGRIAFEMYGGI